MTCLMLLPSRSATDSACALTPTSPAESVAHDCRDSSVFASPGPSQINARLLSSSDDAVPARAPGMMSDLADTEVLRLNTALLMQSSFACHATRDRAANDDG
jgi:hypothetical protein